MNPSYFQALLSVPVLLVTVSILWYIITIRRTKAHEPLPPGPWGLPIVGYLPFLGNNLLQQFTDLATQYGPIFKLRLGSRLCIVIGSQSLTKEILRDQDLIFANRDAPIAVKSATFDENDIVWSPHNSNWRLMRKVLVREMLSNKSLQASYNLRKDEIRRTISDVYAKIGESIEIGGLSYITDFNVMTNVLWGGTIKGEEGDRVLDELRILVPKVVGLLGKDNISDFFPVLAGFDIQGVKKEVDNHMQSVDKIFDKVIAQSKEKLSEDQDDIDIDGRKDFLQILLDLKGNEDPDMSINQTQIKALLMDTIAAATDTSATVEWTMAELMNNPKVMTKVQDELANVVGIQNVVEEFHMPKLKYLGAVLKESLRLHPVAPLLIRKSPDHFSTIGGYTIPRNTKIFINLWAIQRDPSIWDDPSDFKPERFLIDTEKLDYIGNNFHYMPFGSGRRMCAGLALGERMVLYLVASLLHSFDWKLAGDEKLDMTERLGIVLRKSTPLFAIPSPRLSNSNLY
ncbi:hypothetical protein ACJIZ3_009111 [Penstemon smallii]|uniref:Cytochrome P450 n=1 Tax=Penstemon smallii TaxID=265156 RepID=A0ABD3TCF1_9LAMI